MHISNRMTFYLYLINLIMFINSLMFSKLESIIFVMNLLFLVCTSVITVFRMNSRYLCFSRDSVYVVGFCVLNLAYAAVSYPLKNSVEGLFSFIYSLLFLFLALNIDFELKVLKRIYLIMLILFFIWILKIHNYYNFFMVEVYDNGKLNTLNPNTVAILLLILIVFICALEERLGIKKWMQLVIALIGVWGIWNTWSRGALLAILFFSFFNFCIPKQIWKANHSLIMLLYSVVFLFGFIFPLVYVYIAKAGVDSSSFVNGKNIFSGREVIWSEYFTLLKDNIEMLLFGVDVCGIESLSYLNADANNMHNWYLKMLFSFGLFGVIIYYLFILLMLKRLCLRKISNAQITLVIGFMAILVNSYVENIISYHVFPSLVYLMFGLAFSKNMSVNVKGYINTLLPVIKFSCYSIYVRKK